MKKTYAIYEVTKGQANRCVGAYTSKKEAEDYLKLSFKETGGIETYVILPEYTNNA